LKITELQIENDELKMKLNEIEETCQMSSTKMNANIILLEEELLKPNENKSEDNVVILALNGLKQVKIIKYLSRIE
jgi:hypothetical protein